MFFELTINNMIMLMFGFFIGVILIVNHLWINRQSYWITTSIFYGIIAILMAYLLYIPIQKNWFITLVGVFGGVIVSEIIFSLARAGIIRFSSQYSWDIPLLEPLFKILFEFPEKYMYDVIFTNPINGRYSIRNNERKIIEKGEINLKWSMGYYFWEFRPPKIEGMLEIVLIEDSGRMWQLKRVVSPTITLIERPILGKKIQKES